MGRSQAASSAWTRLRDLVARVVPRGALLLSVLTFASYVMGLVRDRVFARTYGAGSDLDVYNAALVLPELALDTLVIAGLSAAFIPVYSRLRAEDGARTDDFARTVLTVSVLIMVVVVAVLFALAGEAMSVVAPGFDAEQRELYVDLFRVMCVTAVIFAASFAIGEMLVVRQRFLAYGLAPVLYNAGIVFGAVFLSPALGILGAAVGTVVGALLHLGIRVLDIRRTEFRYRPALTVRASGFREYVRLAIPRAISAPIEPLTFLYFTSVASTLAAGSISAVSFARNFQSVPVSIIGVAFSVAAFPVMAAAASAGERARFRRLVATNAATIGVLTVGAAITLVLVGGLAIEVFLGGEAFDAEDVATTTLLLGAFALSVPLEALNQLFARAVYSTHDTILPVLASLAGLLVTVVSVSVLADAEGIVGLPLGFAIGQGTRLVLLVGALALRLPTIGRGRPPARRPEADEA
jgi:putative peptidoglycan lipid II flippase